MLKRTSSSNRLPAWLFAFCLVCFSNPVDKIFADGPSIESVRPVAGMRGSTFHVSVTGSGLESVVEVLFYKPGLRTRSLKAIGGEELQIELEAAEDASQGLHPFRLRSSKGLSELKTICVTQYPVLLEANESQESESAAIQRLEGRVSVFGTLSGSHVDRYQVQLEKGERFSAEVEAVRLGIGMLDTVLTLRNPKGEEVASVDDTPLFRQDPALTITADAVGLYTIEVAESGSRRADGSPYLLHVGNFSRPLSCFPLGGPSGTEVDLEWDRGTANALHRRVGLPIVTSPNFPLFAEVNGIPSPTPVPFRVSPFPNAFEQEPNDLLAECKSSEPLSLPIAWNGILAKPNDRDCCWFRVSRGQKMDFEVFACRLGSPLDSVLTIIDEENQVIARGDDLETHDSHLTFEAERDGLIGISIEDKRGQGGEQYAYRLEVTLEKPQVEVFLPRRDRLSQARQTIDVPSGNRVLALLGVRKSVEDGDVTLRFPELPPGVQPLMSQPLAGEYVVPVVFEASQNSTLAGRLVPIEAKLTGSGRETKGTKGAFRQVIDLVGGPADAIYQEIETDRLAISVIEPTPFSIEVLPLKTSLTQDGTLDVEVELTRQPGFESAVEITVPWLPPWVDAEPKTMIPAGETKAKVRLRCWEQAKLGSWPLVLEASPATGRGSKPSPSVVASIDVAPTLPISYSVASAPVMLAIASSPIEGNLSMAVCEQGGTISLDFVLSQNSQKAFAGLAGEWMASLEGLPNRVQCDSVKVDPKNLTIQFKLQLEETAPIGNFVGLTCRLSGEMDGQPVSYIGSRNGSLTIAKPGSIIRDAKGRPLNRLEVLRSQGRD